MSYKLIINSASRIASSQSSANCTVVFNPSIPLEGKNRMRLLSAMIPGTVYNITNLNHTLDFSVGVTLYSITIPNGLYDAVTLASTIQTLMQAAVANVWSVTYSAITKKLTFSGTSAFILLLASGAASSATNNLWQVLGYANSAGTAAADSVSGTSTTSTYAVQLSLPLTIMIKIQNIGTEVISSDNDYCEFTIPNVSQGGSYIEFTSNGNYEQIVRIPYAIRNIGKLDVAFFDRNNVQLDFLNLDWCLIVEFFNIEEKCKYGENCGSE